MARFQSDFSPFSSPRASSCATPCAPFQSTWGNNHTNKDNDYYDDDDDDDDDDDGDDDDDADASEPG